MNGFGRGGEDKQKKERVSVITRETIGMTLLLFSAISFFIAVTGRYVFGDVGVAITAFYLGLFGFLTYPLLVLLMYISVVLVFGKKPVSAKWLVRGGLLVLAVFLIVHTATSERFYGDGYGAYLKGCWSAAAEGAAGGTGGGLIYGLVVYPVRALLYPAGAYVLFTVLVLLALFFIVLGTPLKRYLSFAAKGRKKDGESRAEKRREKHAQPVEEVRDDGVRAYPAAVAFEDISAPPRAPMSAAPAAREQKAQEPPVSRPGGDDYSRSREILYSTDPASSYRNNLIFDHDSYFNTRPRRSSMEQNAEGRELAREESRPAPVRPTYSDSWSRSAEAERPAMPRKITEMRTNGNAGYVYPAADEVNYPQTPSYRAQSEQAPAETEHDYYSHDVPYEEDYSSAPNVDDVPDLPPAPPAPAAPAASKPEPSPDREESVDREAGFRSLFSRPAPEREDKRPVIGFGRDVVPEEEPARDVSALGETRRDGLDFQPRGEEFPARDGDFLRRGDRAFAEEEERDEPEEDSRIFGAPVPERRSDAGLFDDDDVVEEETFHEEPPAPVSRSRDFAGLERRGEFPREMPEEPAPKPVVRKEYVYPSVGLFNEVDDAISVSDEEKETNSAIIVETLAGFKVDARVADVVCGCTVTRYDIDIPGNISASSVIRRSEEVAMRLHAQNGVNMYSNWAKGVISVEVPNLHRSMVGMKSVMQSDEFIHTSPTSLTFVVGKDIEGKNICGDIVKMTHVLVAGTTGSGKSICLHAMITSLICKYTPDELRLILIDPKKNEFIVYEGIPHLMINEIITEAQKVVTALNWSIKEMERRYLLFEQMTRSGCAVRNIDEYNEKRGENEERLPKIVIVVDEYADLVSVAKKDIEDRIQRLAQKSRAAGIHLVIATQRPSADVITGVIKANLPSRIALRVSSELNSRIMLDESGAEKLLGNGDLIYAVSGKPSVRAQGAYVSSDEVQSIVNDIKAHNEAYFDEKITEYINKTGSSEGGAEGGGDAGDGGEVDPQYIKALAIVVKLGSASISLIQRKCSVGYNHAGKIIEWMELMGYISPFDGKAKARTVLLTKEEFESKYGDIDR